MTLAFAGFPVDTFKAAGSTRMFVLSIIRSEADRLGRCHKDQRYLAAKAGIALGTFGYHFGKLKKRGIVVLLRHGRRRKGTIIIRPEHRWVTAEKPAPRASECSKISNTSYKARREEESPPGAPHRAALDEGKPTDVQSGTDEEAEPGRGDGHADEKGRYPIPTPGGPGGSSRRTAYNQPRQPRAPRKLRQRWRRRNAARAFLDAAAEIEARMARAAGRMPPTALAPEPEIITPAEWQRRQQRRSQAPRHPFLEAAERIEREQRGEAPILDPQPWTLIERSLA